MLSSSFQSTPPVKAATRLNQRDICTLRISIHAAREGGDQTAAHPPPPTAISIHAAREGGDAAPPRPLLSFSPFQSTPPVKAATAQQAHFLRLSAISIHAAREGGDVGIRRLDGVAGHFNPRRP